MGIKMCLEPRAAIAIKSPKIIWLQHSLKGRVLSDGEIVGTFERPADSD
jgi:hypothetical protein